MKFFVDDNGRYLGAWDEASVASRAGPPEGAREVPCSPDDARQVFSSGAWGPIPITAESIAARRYDAEVAGIIVNGLQIITDDRSKLLINGAALEATIDPNYTMQWKTPTGFVELTGQQVIGIARAVRAHVQACFDREAELLTALNAGTVTDAMLEQGWP